jgi:hypothetical protein
MIFGIILVIVGLILICVGFVPICKKMRDMGFFAGLSFVVGIDFIIFGIVFMAMGI